MDSPTRSRGITLLALLGMALLSACGPDVCKCLAEAKKPEPDQRLLQSCRETFAEMSESELQSKVEECK